MKTYVSMPPRIIDLNTRGEWSGSVPGRFTPRGKSLRYPLDERLDGRQSRSGRCEGKISCPLTGIETRVFGRPACRELEKLELFFSSPTEYEGCMSDDTMRMGV
jgi:hypothetical protein